MKQLIDDLIKKYSLNQETIDLIYSFINDREFSKKDLFIIKNLIKFNLDINSIIAYIVTEYNIENKELDADVLSLKKNLEQIELNELDTDAEQDPEIMRKQFIAMCNDIRVIIIKLMLVLYKAKNCKKPLSCSDKQFLLNVRNLYAPLSERLGLNAVKTQLEDICLKFLNSKIYNELKQNVLLKKEENEKQIQITKKKLDQIIQELNLKDAIIMSRQKHYSSIYKKLQTKNVSLANIYDLIAMRVIVGTVEECYAVLGKIHGIYKPMEGRFKDYISNPKPNGYQSLHTTIIVENNRPMEVQIRTHKMHKISEFGVDVAHWIYKEKRKTTELDKKMAWLRQIMDQSANLTNQEFVETLKTNLYSGRIFVQTPKGKVLEFPEGANIIDFAYAIHSDIGNNCVGGKINGKIMPLTTKLKSNDIVEIITSQNSSKGPSRDWLGSIKTSEARDKINAYFKKELKEENIKNGIALLELALKDKGLPVQKVLQEENFSSVLKKYCFNNIQEVYAAVGYGSVATNQIVNKLILEYEKNQNILKPKTNLQTLVIKRNKDGVLVDGDSGILVRYAGCCNPILGEEIVGYISRGRGVTVHNKNCENLKYLEKERFIDATWADNTSTFKIQNIQITANLDENFITKLSAVLLNSKFSIVEFDSKILANKYICKVKIKTDINSDISNLIADIKKFDNILEVEHK